MGVTARTRREPEVAAVHENNLVLINVGKAHQTAFRHFLAKSGAGQTDNPQQRQALEIRHQGSFLVQFGLKQFQRRDTGRISVKSKTCDCISFNRLESLAVIRCFDGQDNKKKAACNDNRC